MNAPAPRAFDAVEPTAIGLQSVMPGVAPITQDDRLAWRAAAPLIAARPQPPCDVGLFDLNARDQLDLFAKLPPSDRGG
jgi:hypothetical protein